MEVCQEFYHIHRISQKYSDKWEVGNTIHFGDDDNPLCDRVFNPEINIHSEVSYIKYLANQTRSANSVNEKNNIQSEFFQQCSAFKYLQLTREVVFEAVRSQLFPDKPSRLKGIWLSDAEDFIKWKRILPAERFRQRIFVVRLTGRVHKGDERWITNRSLSFESYYHNAVGYWQGLGKLKTRKPTNEYIATGDLEIIREIN